MTAAALPTLRTPQRTLRLLDMNDANVIVEGVGYRDASKKLGAGRYLFARACSEWSPEKFIEIKAMIRMAWRALRKIGFAGTDRGSSASKARLEPAPVITYAVTRDTPRVAA